MSVPYQMIGDVEVRGWSIMSCTNKDAHDLHSWNADFLRFGPYACPGVLA